MTEREKMQNRKLYDANDRSLCADRVRAKELCHAYNQLCPSDEAGTVSYTHLTLPTTSRA